jgi:hypothetical protein
MCIRGGRAPNVKTCLNFQRKRTSTTEDFLHFIRYWKIVAEFLRLTMVTYIHLENLGQIFTCKARTKHGAVLGMKTPYEA